MSYAHNKLKGHRVFWQSGFWDTGKKSSNNLSTLGQRTPEKQKEPPTLWNWRPQGPLTTKTIRNSEN